LAGAPFLSISFALFLICLNFGGRKNFAKKIPAEDFCRVI